MKKYAGWFVEGAPSLFPTLEDATAWRQAQIWQEFLVRESVVQLDFAQRRRSDDRHQPW